MSAASLPDRILGYSNRDSVAPGESIAFMLSCSPCHGPLRTEVVRVFCATDHPDGPGNRLEPVPSAAKGEYPARLQSIHPGSHIVIEPRFPIERAASFTVSLFVWPTLPMRGRQALISRWSERGSAGFRLVIGPDGSLALDLGDGSGKVETVTTGCTMLAHEWYHVAASYDAIMGEVHLWQRPLAYHPLANDAGTICGHTSVRPQPPAGTALTIAAWQTDPAVARPAGGGHFNGKIDRPCLLDRALKTDEASQLLARPWSPQLAPNVVGDWDFSIGITGDAITDVSGNGLHGIAVNTPTRGVSGHCWSGATIDWTQKPIDYGAIHFHEDDLTDCDWSPDVAVQVGQDWPSGIYALRVVAGSGSMVEHFQFYVRPPKGTATARAVFLASTATYLAYTNLHRSHRAIAEAISGKLTTFTAEDLFLNGHPELGLSAYDTHLDGSGVCYSSRLRPDLENRVNGRIWNFALDTLLIDWLDRFGTPIDIVTDEDLHREGAALLAPYAVVLTGSHPEYFSRSMLDAFEAYLRQGGRVMYMGGNGFYWRIAFHPTRPGLIENRRTVGSTRTWAVAPQESQLSFSGEPAGLWRSHGRAPQRLVGVGFAAQGFDRSSWFERRPGSQDPRASFIFEGISLDGRIGDHGLIDGGAAGLELDRADRTLGTPAHALVLASSVEHTNVYRIASEEVLVSNGAIDGTNNEDVRADMVFFETMRGGGVFSTGSIAWIGSLPSNGYDNDVARITGNVLRRFLDPTPLIASD